MKRLSILIAFLIGLVQFTSATVSKAEADKDYQENKFADAIEKYEAILSSEGESAAIYYNLGNSYYKNKNIAKAVLNYERALLMNPGDADIRFNLDMARSKTNCLTVQERSSCRRALPLKVPRTKAVQTCLFCTKARRFTSKIIQ